MQPAEKLQVSEDEYIARERLAETKSELVNGFVIAMAGSSPRHAAIALNIGVALNAALRGQRCRVFPSDLRVHVEATGLYTYPDVTVACGGPRFHPKFKDTLVNPKVIVEVLSGSTEAYDRGAKFAHYQSIASLAEYVLVSQDEERVEHFQRLDSGQWLLTTYQGNDAKIALPALGCEIALADVYANLEGLEPEAARS